MSANRQDYLLMKHKQASNWWRRRGGSSGRLPVLLGVLTYKVDVNAKDGEGRSPLWNAVERGHKAVVRRLLKMEEVDANSEDDMGQTPLFSAISHGQEAIVQLLIANNKVDINASDRMKRSSLSHAARNGKDAIVKLLLSKGCNDKAADRRGRTPLSWAAANGHDAIVKRLIMLYHGLPQIIAKTLSNYFSQLRESMWILKTRAAERRCYGRLRPPKQCEILKCCIVAIVTLTYGGSCRILKSSSNFCWKMAPMSTPRTIVVGRRCRILPRGGTRIVLVGRRCRILPIRGTKNGAEFGAKDNHSRTPLSYAAEKGQEVIVKLLLENGADANTKDNNGQTPAQWATKNRHEAIVELLRRQGKTARKRRQWQREGQ
ncbi:ankyrin repeats (3 copies) domain-containing protein [Cordyceps javanica]|nr:ankyrin repeats (3 copies) domain-containing protein [Cordyceps javanica]